ncbi:MAG: NUDIX domain-containing protein [Patescibacteria group bacterium]
MEKDYSYGIIPIRKTDDAYQFLIILHMAGHWGFPKGHKEDGENDNEAARRELLEEVGIGDIRIDQSIKLYDKYIYSFNEITYDKTVTYFPGFVPENIEIKIDQKEVVDYKWASFEEALDILTFDNQKNNLKEINKWLNDDSTKY